MNRAGLAVVTLWIFGTLLLAAVAAVFYVGLVG